MDQLTAGVGINTQFQDTMFLRDVLRRAGETIRKSIAAPLTVTDVSFSAGKVEQEVPRCDDLGGAGPLVARIDRAANLRERLRRELLAELRRHRRRRYRVEIRLVV